MEAETSNGIGSLNERALHLALKNYFDPDVTHHEIPVGGFVADIKDGSRITEIETRSFSNLRKKLPVLLENNSVTVVFPVAVRSSFVVVDENGVAGAERRSTKRERPTDIFGELLKITDFIGHPGLDFVIVLIETLEYRVPVVRRGRKSTRRVDRVPVSFKGSIGLKTPSDFAGLVVIPEGSFTSKTFAAANRLKDYDAWEALTVLENIGVVSCSKGKKPFIYRSARNALSED